eukprot:243506-Amphidinium_carterae.1
MCPEDFRIQADPTGVKERGSLAKACSFVGTDGSIKTELILGLKRLACFLVCVFAYGLGKPTSAWANEAHVNWIKKALGWSLPSFSKPIRDQLDGMARNLQLTPFAFQLSRLLDITVKGLPEGPSIVACVSAMTPALLPTIQDMPLELKSRITDRVSTLVRADCQS